MYMRDGYVGQNRALIEMICYDIDTGRTGSE